MREEKSYIFLARCGDRLKIGRSWNPSLMLRKLEREAGGRVEIPFGIVHVGTRKEADRFKVMLIRSLGIDAEDGGWFPWSWRVIARFAKHGERL